MKKVIIFGGSGFIGKHLIEQLKDDYEVIVITRRPKTMANELSKDIKIERLRSIKVFDGGTLLGTATIANGSIHL